MILTLNFPTKHLPFIFLWRFGPTRAGQGLLILEVTRPHTTTHHRRQDSSGWVISSSQRPLPDNTQHSQQTSMPPVGFESTISAIERPQTYAFDRTTPGTGSIYQLVFLMKAHCVLCKVWRASLYLIYINLMVDRGKWHNNQPMQQISGWWCRVLVLPCPWSTC